MDQSSPRACGSGAKRVPWSTVRDLLGDSTAPASGFVPEAGQFGFDNAALGATLSDVVVEQFESAARELAANAVTKMPSLLACDVAAEGEDGPRV